MSTIVVVISKTRVGIVTDSSACLPPSIVERLPIAVVPVTVHVPTGGRAEPDRAGAEQVTEGGEHMSHRISEAIEQDQFVRSSHPFITDYLAAIEESPWDEVVVVTPAMEFAGMYRNASMAVDLAARPAVALDSRTAAAGQALVVLAGAEAAAAGGQRGAGASAEAVARAVEDTSRRVELVASLETLSSIRRSHRVPAPVLAAADLEEMRSVFRMRGGAVEPLGSTSTNEMALEAITKEWRSSTVGAAERAAIFHAECPEMAARLESMIGPVDFVSGFSAAMQIHTGRGVVGAAWVPR
jgi:DegV family protein with EDD domain